MGLIHQQHFGRNCNRTDSTDSTDSRLDLLFAAPFAPEKVPVTKRVSARDFSPGLAAESAGVIVAEMTEAGRL